MVSIVILETGCIYLFVYLLTLHLIPHQNWGRLQKMKRD